MTEPIHDYVVTAHAAAQMRRRNISESVLREVLADPEQRLPVRQGRDVLQRRVVIGGRQYLVRVIVDVNRRPAEVVTVYRTSKIEKYWRGEL